MSNLNKKFPSIIFAGHLAIDTIIRFQKEHKDSLGGSVSYSSLALRTYTQEDNIRIISNLGRFSFIDDSLLDLFKDKNIDLGGIKWSETKNTNFILDYHNNTRTLTLKSRSPNLDIKDIPQDYLQNPPDVFVLVPLCNEISLDYVLAILTKFPETYIGIDLQGFLRIIDDNGNVSLERNDKIISNMNDIINFVGDKMIMKGSEEEMKILAGKKDLYEIMEYFNDLKFKGISIMTLGEKGSMITQHGKSLLVIPAFKPKTVSDETGAGDVYLAIFLHEFMNSDRSWEAIGSAGYIASAAASFLVEENGPSGFQSREKILERVNSKNYIN